MSVQGQELNWVTLVGPFQLRTFPDPEIHPPLWGLWSWLAQTGWAEALGQEAAVLA